MAVKAQKTDTTKTSPTLRELLVDEMKKEMQRPGVFSSIEHMPEFQGGNEAFTKYLITNIHYPEASFKKKIQGRVVLVVDIDKDGSLKNIKVVKSVAEDIDQEAVRVLQNSPNWIPGRQNGKNIMVKYAVPINFVL